MTSSSSDPSRTGLSLGKVATYCGVTRKTILRWVNDNLIQSYVLPSGHHRVEPEEVVRFLNAHDMPVPAELGSPGGKRALVCEDDEQIRRVIRDVLKKHFTVTEASNGIEACIRLGESPPDLLVLDIRMPKMDGVAVCRQISSDPRFARTRIVIVSAYLDETTKEDLAPLIHGFVQKPFSPRELSETCLAVTGTGPGT